MSVQMPPSSRETSPDKAKPLLEEVSGPAYDPFGIYGTRSAQRIRTARTQRLVQKFTVLAAAIAFFGAIIGLIFAPPVSLVRAERLGIASPLSAAPVAATDEEGTVLLLPGEAGELLRFDPQRGTGTTCLETDFPLRASPLVQGKTAFVPSENGVLTALDWRRGKIIWQRSTGAPLTARPAAVQWQTLQPVAVPTSTPIAASAENAGTSAVEAPLAVTAPHTEPVIKTHKLVVAGNDAGVLSALHAGTGKTVWSRSVGAPVGNGIVAVSPSVAGATPRVLVPLLQDAGSPGGLWCLDGRSGAVLWKYPANNRTTSPQVAPPTVDIVGRRVFCADDAGTLSCLDLKSGQKIWKKFVRAQNPSSGELVLLRSEPLFRRYAFGAIVVLGGSDGIVRCFGADDGMLLWEFNAGAPVRARPLPLLQNLSDSESRDLLLIGCDSSSLPVLDPQSGRSICSLQASSSAPFGVVPAGEQLCTVTTSGVVEEFVF